MPLESRQDNSLRWSLKSGVSHASGGPRLYVEFTTVLGDTSTSGSLSRKASARGLQAEADGSTYRASRSGFDFLGVVSTIVAVACYRSGLVSQHGTKERSLVRAGLHAISRHWISFGRSCPPSRTRTRRPDTLPRWCVKLLLVQNFNRTSVNLTNGRECREWSWVDAATMDRDGQSRFHRWWTGLWHGQGVNCVTGDMAEYGGVFLGRTSRVCANETRSEKDCWTRRAVRAWSTMGMSRRLLTTKA